MKPLYIFGLDGALALNEHRAHMPELEVCDKWRHFDAAYNLDAPNTPLIETMDRLLRAGAEVLIYSGRSNKFRATTMAWLSEYTGLMMRDLEGGVLQMREECDHAPEDVLKRRWYEEMSREDKERLVVAFDGIDRAVSMWKSIGVPCFHVVESELCLCALPESVSVVRLYGS